MSLFTAAPHHAINLKRAAVLPLAGKFLVLFFFFGLFTPVHAVDELSHVTLAAENSWPPFSKADGSGLSNQIIREAYETQGIDVKYVVAPYARQLVATQNGAYVGVFNVTKEPSTMAKFLFCKERLFKATTAYYVHEDRPLSARSYKELNAGERIGLIIGYEYGPFIIANTRVRKHTVANQSALIKMLLVGRLDTVIMFDAIAQYTLPTIANSHKIKRAFDGEHSDIYVAFSRRHKDAPYFCEKLDKGLQTLRTTGRLQEILGAQAVP